LTTPREAKRVVRTGYDACAASYLSARASSRPDLSLLARFCERLRDRARVLDAGCGAGVPVARWLTAAGYPVVGADLSSRQLEIAGNQVPGIRRVQADLSALPFAPGSFGGVVSYYAIIHVPRAEHGEVLHELRRVLATGGIALLCLGARDLPDDHDTQSWLGVEMYWSHYDADTNLQLIAAAGFAIDWHRLVADPLDHGRHLFVHATAT